MNSTEPNFAEKGKLPDLTAAVNSFNKNKLLQNLPWVEKYRPASLDELVSHEDITSTILKFINQNTLPHMLFYGPPGTGKTSTILACARKMFPPSSLGKKSTTSSMILELNASDERGIDVVRQQIISFASTKSIMFSGNTGSSLPKLIILDEADAMTQPAQAALRRVMEKYTKNVRFCFICNYVGKIIPAIQSRCTRFRFAPLTTDQIETRLDFICKKEGVLIDEAGKRALLSLTAGDMRKMLNILQSVHISYHTVNENTVYASTGNPRPADIQTILKWLLEQDFNSALTNISQLKLGKGLALQDLLTSLFDQLKLLVDMPSGMKMFLIDELAELEYNLSNGCSENIQLANLVSIFQISKDLTARSLEKSS